MELLIEIDNENENIIIDKNISVEVMLTSLKISLSKHNLKLIQLILSSFPFSSSFLTSLYNDYACEGTSPEIINILQDYLSPSERSFYLRYYLNLRQHSFTSFYVIDPLEERQLQQLYQNILKIETIKKDSQLIYLKKLRVINDFLLDSAIGDRRLCLSRVLELKPSMTVINEAFVAVCKRHNFTVATILSPWINQQGFDEAFFYAIEDDDIDSIEWLLKGIYGFLPNQDKLNEAFRQIQLSINSHPRKYVGNASRQICSIIQSRIPESIQKLIEEEIQVLRRVEERRRQQRTLFQIYDPDIHSYSAVSIEQPINNNNNNDNDNNDDNVIRVNNENTNNFEELNEIENNLIQPNNNRSRVSLNEAIVAHMNSRVGENVREDIDQTMSEMLSLIRSYIPTTQQQNAITLLGEILNSDSVKLFATTLTFLKSFGSSSRQVIETWIQGFLSESVVMHSCNPGALERVVTGLRGINDPQLDQIFSKAEAPQLINIFLKTAFNIFYDDKNIESKIKANSNAEKLARELISRGVTNDTSPTDIQRMLEDYAYSVISSYDTNIKRYQGEVLLIIEIVVDNYDTHLKHYVINFLSSTTPNNNNNNNNNTDELNSMNIETKDNN